MPVAGDSGSGVAGVTTAEKQHDYAVKVSWTGNKGDGTASYQAYSRAHRISASGKPDIEGSSDPSFRGDPAR